MPCFTMLRFIAFHGCGVFKQTEGKTLQEQKDYDSLYCNGLEPNLQYLLGMPVAAFFIIAQTWKQPQRP